MPTCASLSLTGIDYSQNVRAGFLRVGDIEYMMHLVDQVYAKGWPARNLSKSWRIHSIPCLLSVGSQKLPLAQMTPTAHKAGYVEGGKAYNSRHAHEVISHRGALYYIRHDPPRMDVRVIEDNEIN
ncbi:hypothetical protein PIIN_07384 [Serendipita indica DSM 11827]|uniref:Uncharacterized protein n=1 Tax=Serendipita indica (strain DSM 11827) TaxID=1109443 RepID=G4TQ38_SERID|nr:hypothetical protein PIIN_07384 [Serendipita indica DSM 11827]